jgi:restriction endonuclease S subunit
LEKLKSNPNWAKLPLFNRKNWSRVRFGDIVENVNERVEPSTAAEAIYVGLDDLDSGNLHIRRWGKGSDVIGTKLGFRKGDVIFGRRRAYQRKLAVAEVDGICSAHAMVARAKPKVVLPEFLPLLMMSDKFMNRAVDISVGSLSPTINWTTLKLEEFDLPPLDQQRRIAEILWAVDEAIQQNLHLRDTCAASLEAVFESHTHPNSNSDWPLVELETVVAKFIDYRGKTPKKTTEGVPWCDPVKTGQVFM